MKQHFSFQRHITDKCDQRCKHCYIFSGDSCKKLDSMTWEQMQDVVDNCCDMCEIYDRLPHFYLTGGDPILHPDFWRLLALLKERGIPFTVMGNPFHLNDEVCRRLKSYGCQKYQLSLDGMRETHDWFRKPGSFDCTLGKISCINSAGIRSVIMTTVSGRNIKEVPNIIDTVVECRMNLARFDRSRLAGFYVSREQPSSIDDPTIQNGFYGAPSVCVVFAQRDFLYSVPDAYCYAENMVLMATELGISSCIVARGEETFDSEAGAVLLREWGIPENYIARCFVLLGYVDGEYPGEKPRRAGRGKIVEG